MNQTPRKVSSDLLEALDPLERIIATKYVKEGRWVLIGQDQQLKQTI